MRIALLTLVLLHALIHLAGFVKGFGLSEIKALTIPISKPVALLWLIACIVFLLFGYLYFFRADYAWFVGVIAVSLSQVLIVLSWKDARFGTIPNLIVLLMAIAGLGYFLLKADFRKHVSADFTTNNKLSTSIITEQDLTHLPPIVKKYLSYTRSVGKPRIKNFQAEFQGGMRGKPEDSYMKMQSVQYNFYNKPSRYFFMEAVKMGMPATGLHKYQNQTAAFEVKMLNWLRVVDARGEKLNRAETVTLFNDMCCIAPATLIDHRITWKSINDTLVNAVFTNGQISITAELYFKENGELVNFRSNDRYETDGVYYNNYPWSTPLEQYKMINGYYLPGKARLVYHKPDGDFTYGELEYMSVKYNLEVIED
jgi:hypothetical protein